MLSNGKKEWKEVETWRVEWRVEEGQGNVLKIVWFNLVTWLTRYKGYTMFTCILLYSVNRAGTAPFSLGNQTSRLLSSYLPSLLCFIACRPVRAVSAWCKSRRVPILAVGQVECAELECRWIQW